MPAPGVPFQPYADVHEDPQGAGDGRPTALQVTKDCGMMGKLAGKVAVITGASAGIGIETARALYEAGAELILPARGPEKIRKVIDDIQANAQYNKSGLRPEAVEMDLSSLESVRNGAEAIKAKTDKVNILILNAGIMAVPYGKTADGFETHMGVNHFAEFLLFQELKAQLAKAAKDSGTCSRVIVVSSAGHRNSGIRFDDMHWDKDPSSYNAFLGYGQSKTANVYLANSITRHCAAQNILAWSVHPGAILTTELTRHMTPQQWESFGDLSVFRPIAKSMEQGAATQVWAAVAPYFEKQNGGRYLADVGESGPQTPDTSRGGPEYAPHAYNEEAEERLWALSYDAVGLTKDY
ncbi:hypothetical protein BAUCODRAFT_65569 [Baudoinia panamericana UAMH 10762]|uniref:Uncharacterized protein n=1 Tax=Baudoinia panamericana (strain UAMH 10762) TaxID=717646 RepID=M2NJ56_BAUPA|nr:uncharacterized protein BAUCODRAFT_65569 [Baudoinia panamericana UAMH 10762]EMC99155.1 hypothetical protein BAUCODRAFT_65569 [Baudoinia panamericana UAMH 10762]